MKTRRRFLGQAAAVIAGAALIPSTLGQGIPRPRTAVRRRTLASLERLDFETFERLTGTAFVVRAADGNRGLLLVRAERHARRTEIGSPAIDSFSLLFKQAIGQPLCQDTHLFYHSRIGDFPMFIVPVARRIEGQQYEAVFNRLAG